ncbi:MAG TPA: hypothetical protein DCX14_14610 [Flavobacteriales bacterium]|jgi:ubiquinone/menaquinone biosynthesis C-methylase UbiE|nr:class I SAM-dependent methyltransferase [Flavobacteriales bacterium]HAW21411.1 hypothetical protein [Flavobacteriales bacterium]
MSGFDLVAPYYDHVVRIVFGQKINNFNRKILASIAPVKRCMIIGGGSGKILLDAIEMNLASSYCYAELSSKMKKKAKDRLNDRQLQQVTFTADYSETDSRFDLIVLPFVLDCYSESSVHQFLYNLEPILTNHGKLLIIDFNHEPLNDQRPTFIQKQFIRLLYLFFRVTSNIEAKKLPRILSILKDSNFTLISRDRLYNGWIVSSVYGSAKNDDVA